MNEELLEISDILLKELRTSYPSNVFALWFKSLKMKALTGDEAILTIDNEFKKNIVEKKYLQKLTEIISDILGFSVNIHLEVEVKEEDPFTLPPIPDPGEKEEKNDIDEYGLPIKPSTPLTATAIEGTDIVEEYTFDNFIVGNSNKFAHAASMAVAHSPASIAVIDSSSDVYNPLFIWGPSGLGKTHLLYAITNELKKNHPSFRIMFKKCEDFTNELIESIRSKNTAAFRDKFRSVDVLLIDDVQFLTNREATQEEFFNTFNELYESDKQIILTSDRPPKDIQHLTERLRSRFEWGWIVDIQKPDIELRTAIIRKKNEDFGVTMPDDVVNFLATNIRDNIRQIEGSIRKISAISRIIDSPINLDMAKRAIADILVNTVTTSDMIDRIFNLVSSHYGISIEDIKGKKRDAAIANARHVCIYLIRQMNDLSLKQIAELFSRDHATIISSNKKIANEIELNEERKAEIDGFIKSLNIN